jgi:hypothetical protein
VDSFGHWQSRLSAAEKTALNSYSEFGYKGLNEDLRSGAAFATDIHGATIKRLDAAINRGRILRDVYVYRGRELPGGLDARRLVGRTIKDRAFVSTSLSRRTGETFAGGSLLVRVRLKAGTKAAALSKIEENEVLLPRNSKFRIKSVKRTKDGLSVAEAEYIPPARRKKK